MFCRNLVLNFSNIIVPSRSRIMPQLPDRRPAAQPDPGLVCAFIITQRTNHGNSIRHLFPNRSPAQRVQLGEGRRNLRICSFRGAYAYRGNGMEHFFDVMERFACIFSQGSGTLRTDGGKCEKIKVFASVCTGSCTFDSLIGAKRKSTPLAGCS